MKATDLMIGDLLLHKGQPIKVEEILIDGINPMWDGTENYGNEAYYKDLQPIPLTPEILEKNGIKLFHTYTHPYRDGEWEEGELEEERKKYPMSVYQTLNLNPYIVFVAYPDEQELKVYSSDYKTKVEKKEEVIFVHELQLALRLCKINKEIKI